MSRSYRRDAGGSTSKVPGGAWNSGIVRGYRPPTTDFSPIAVGIRLLLAKSRRLAAAGKQAIRVVDGVDALDRRQQRLEVGGVGQLEVELHAGNLVAADVGLRP